MSKTHSLAFIHEVTFKINAHALALYYSYPQLSIFDIWLILASHLIEVSLNILVDNSIFIVICLMDMDTTFSLRVNL